MGEFKFACPVCGQHLTAAAGDAGSRIECPTCFQKIIVPSFQGGSDSKLVIAGTLAEKPRSGLPTAPDSVLLAPQKASTVPGWAWGLLVLVAAGAVAFVFKDKWLPGSGPGEVVVTNAPTAKPKLPPPPIPVPTNTRWTLLLTNAAIPTARVAGRVNGQGFRARRVVFIDGVLGFRQMETGQPDMGVILRLPAATAVQLSGRTFEYQPGDDRPFPRVTLRWKNPGEEPGSRTITNEYALRLVFGQTSSNRIPGQIYLALPDEQRSFIAGHFEADLRPPGPKKKSAPKPPAPPPVKPK